MSAAGHIQLIDLIRLAGVELADWKIHCATGAGPDSPLEAFFNGTFRQWQEHQTRKNFECAQVLSLIHLGGSRWLFAGVHQVIGVAPMEWRGKHHFAYQTREEEGLGHLVGRTIVAFDKKFRASYLRGEKHESRLLVAEIRGEPMRIGDFPGFNRVLLSHGMLRTLVRQANPSWRAALAHVAGVYLITDTKAGSHYVGSARGGEGLWQRWSAYAATGHGGNVELRAVLEREGDGYAEHFQYSLLEVCDINSGEDAVLARESHWKRVLMTRAFGLNRN